MLKRRKNEKETMMMEKEFSFPTAKEEEIYRKRLEAKIESYVRRLIYR